MTAADAASRGAESAPGAVAVGRKAKPPNRRHPPSMVRRLVVLHAVLSAAVLLAAAPTLLVYLFGGRYFLRGLTSGAVK